MFDYLLNTPLRGKCRFTDVTMMYIYKNSLVILKTLLKLVVTSFSFSTREITSEEFDHEEEVNINRSITDWSIDLTNLPDIWNLSIKKYMVEGSVALIVSSKGRINTVQGCQIF